MKMYRHTQILKLIEEKDIETQEELAYELRNHGFDVTQATVSRDIKELRLIKVLTLPENTNMQPWKIKQIQKTGIS